PSMARDELCDQGGRERHVGADGDTDDQAQKDQDAKVRCEDERGRAQNEEEHRGEENRLPAEPIRQGSCERRTEGHSEECCGGENSYFARAQAALGAYCQQRTCQYEQVVSVDEIPTHGCERYSALAAGERAGVERGCCRCSRHGRPCRRCG